jgi:acetoin utilization deacetylase AcuC-like enzyme
MAATVRELGRELPAPVLAALEGGYEPSALADSVLATVRALGGDEQPRRASSSVADAARARLAAGRWAEVLA